MNAAFSTLSGWRGPLPRRIASPRAQAAPIALTLFNAVILGLETGEGIYATFMHGRAARHSSAPSKATGKCNPLLDLRVSIVLTGAIGLLELDTQWPAAKEVVIPGLIGFAVVVSTRTRYPLVKTLLYKSALINVARVQQSLNEKGNAALFEARMQTATYLLGGTFFFSSFMNCVLATWIVTSPAGSAAFNEELRRMTLWSYPMIAIPSMFMMMAVLCYRASGMRERSWLKLTYVVMH